MFDIGFAELLVILVLGLVVLGPERLHQTARITGAILAKAKAAVADMQRGVEQSVPVEEAKEIQRELSKLRPSNIRRSAAVVIAGEEAAHGDREKDA